MNKLKLKPVVSIIALAAVTLFLFGCTEFVNPLVPPDEGKVDKKLSGHWLELNAGGEESKGYIDFTPGVKDMTATQVSSTGSTNRYTIILSKLKDNRYMSIYTSSNGGGYYIYRYEIAPNKTNDTVLTVWSIPSDTIARAFTAKQLSYIKTSNGDDRITSSIPDLQKWIQTLGDLDWLVAYRYKKAK